MTWREEAKSLGIPMYRRLKVDVLKDIEAKKNKPAGKTRVVITRQEAVDVCCAALKAHAAIKGLDPDKEILVSQWYLQMNRHNMTFIGQELEETEDERTGEEGIGATEGTERVDGFGVPEGAG